MSQLVKPSLILLFLSYSLGVDQKLREQSIIYGLSTVDYRNGTKCSEDLEKFAVNAENRTMWALKSKFVCKLRSIFL